MIKSKQPIKEQTKKVWGLNRWYEKIAYVIGVIMTILYVIFFFIGMIEGILE